MNHKEFLLIRIEQWKKTLIDNGKSLGSTCPIFIEDIVVDMENTIEKCMFQICILLPIELLVEISLYLPLQDLHSFIRTCKRLNTVLITPHFWKQYFLAHWSNEHLHPKMKIPWEEIVNILREFNMDWCTLAQCNHLHPRLFSANRTSMRLHWNDTRKKIVRAIRVIDGFRVKIGYFHCYTYQLDRGVIIGVNQIAVIGKIDPSSLLHTWEFKDEFIQYKFAYSEAVWQGLNNISPGFNFRIDDTTIISAFIDREGRFRRQLTANRNGQLISVYRRDKAEFIKNYGSISTCTRHFSSDRLWQPVYLCICGHKPRWLCFKCFHDDSPENSHCRTGKMKWIYGIATCP